VNIGFGGHRDAFHNTTIKEATESAISEGRANGYDPVPITNHGSGPNANQLKKLTAHHKARPVKDAI